jgi:hypothetical protein
MIFGKRECRLGRGYREPIGGGAEPGEALGEQSLGGNQQHKRGKKA